MKFALFSLLFALLAVMALAAASQQDSVVVSYPNETPEHVLDEAKKAIVAAGGMITHEYKLIKAFAAKAPAKALDTVRTMGSQWNAIVEEDKAMHANGNGF